MFFFKEIGSWDVKFFPDNIFYKRFFIIKIFF